MRITRKTARRLMLHAQGLDEPWDLPPGSAGAAQAIERLGYVQIDTIYIVERAHHHVLWTRQRDYHPEQLHELLTVERKVFEYWTHAASYLPMSRYRYYLSAMRAARRRERTRQLMAEHAEVIAHVRQRIRAEGPLSAADFEAPEGFTSGWWQRKPAKVALDLLFNTGELMIHERRNFQRVYDLAERVLPADADGDQIVREPDPDEARRFMAREVLRTRGLADDRHLRGWLTKAAFARTMSELVEAGEALEIEVEGDDGRRYYALADAMERASTDDGHAEPRLHILSPFDNLIIHRPPIDRLFGFAYRLECYLPQAKRRYGYFCLPVLWGDRLMARIDAKADRAEGTLLVRSLILEPDVERDDALLAALAEGLADLARFNGCQRVLVERTDPATLLDPLAALLG
jgi:uncharacterized protein